MAYSELNYVDNGGGDIQVGVEQPIGTFFDGTNTYIRYRKTVDFGTLPNNTDSHISLGSTFVGVLDVHGILKNSTTWIPFEYVEASSSNTIASLACVFVRNTDIYVRTRSDLRSYTALITIEYYR